MTKYVRAAHDSGPRPASAVRLIVLHSTEGGTAASVAAMFHRQSATASTHFVVDDRETIRMLPDLVVPWGAPGANYHGLHMEHCGFAKWTRAEWRSHDAELLASAEVIGKWSFLYGIPLQRLTVDQLKAGQRGVVTHLDCTRAFPGGSHTDPGPGFPISYLLGRARQVRKRLEAAHP